MSITVLYWHKKRPYQTLPWRLTNDGVGVSRKMTETAGTVLGETYPGNTATGMEPWGISANASDASGVSPRGLAPPPGVPGKGLPGGT